jgi:5'-3' exonuclease
MHKLIIDCHNLAYRAFHTTGTLDLGVVFGFMSQILTLAEDLESDRFIFCWDSKRNFRKTIMPDYKGNRAKKDEEEQRELDKALEQFKMLRTEVIPNLGFVNNFVQPGYEADDLISHIVHRFPDNYVIVSGDEDLYQLLFEDIFTETKIYQPIKKNLVTIKSFVTKYGIDPTRWSKVKALAGCSSDNVKGIVGVGEKKAIQYLTGQMKKGTIFDRIEEEKDEVIKKNFPIVDLPFGGDRPINIKHIYDESLLINKFLEVFTRLEFGSFLKDDKFDKWVEMLNLEDAPF